MVSFDQLLTSQSWKGILSTLWAEPWRSGLEQFLQEEYDKGETIYPPTEEIFSAFNLLEPNDARVILIGQDPYHGKNQGHGVAFSVKEGHKVPPSLRNMLKEIEISTGKPAKAKENLEGWVDQGVFLLNTVLTVREGKPNSHKKKGWETFTDGVIKELSNQDRKKIFLLWGNPAQAKAKLIDESKHIVLTAPHPSPLSASRGFFGCDHFVEVNRLLTEWGEDVIEW